MTSVVREAAILRGRLELSKMTRPKRTRGLYLVVRRAPEYLPEVLEPLQRFITGNSTVRPTG